MSFILITNDQSSLSGSTVHAIKIVKFRLTKGSWPLYPETKNRDKLNERRREAYKLKKETYDKIKIEI